jgi:Escherichia/Staphylococcus phage prohead protease
MLQRFGETLPEREVKFAPVDLKSVEADGTFCGYASLFGTVDLGQDLVMPGAFRESLAARGTRVVKLLFQHDPNEPIGVWLDIHEDARGLFVKGKLTTEVERAREVLSLMRSGALDGLSIGYRTVRGRTDAKTGLRRLMEVDLWEISVVTFPMLPEARISAVKAGRLPTLREFERVLVQDAGLTRSEARTVIRSGYHALSGRRDAAGGSDQRLVLTLKRAARLFQS